MHAQKFFMFNNKDVMGTDGSTSASNYKCKKQFILYQSYEYKLTQQNYRPAIHRSATSFGSETSLKPKMFKLLDTGGQPEFADFLPAISASSYFIDICFSCGLVCLDQLNTINDA